MNSPTLNEFPGLLQLFEPLVPFRENASSLCLKCRLTSRGRISQECYIAEHGRDVYTYTNRYFPPVCFPEYNANDLKLSIFPLVPGVEGHGHKTYKGTEQIDKSWGRVNRFSPWFLGGVFVYWGKLMNFDVSWKSFPPLFLLFCIP